MLTSTSRGSINQVAAKYLKIIHETSHYIAVSKPPFTICQDEPNNASSLSNLLRSAEPQLFEEKPAPFHAPKGVHRLDALVTGCVLYGTSVYGTRQLAKNFRNRKVKKGYLALLQPSSVSASILETSDAGVIDTGDRKTYWNVLARLRAKHRRIYICWLSPVEGRNHQLRMHAAENLQAPVMYDRRYLPQDDKSHAREMYEQVEEEGIALHCASLKFPLGLKTEHIVCTPPELGVWARIAEEFHIDWEAVVRSGVNHKSSTE